VFITSDDGSGRSVRLAADLFLPDGPGPFAALLEALPYRKDDLTASYRSTYERYVDAGFAVLRLDLRGTGSSTGIADDEYPDPEVDDLARAIQWLADQPWSNGRVGMFGTSYSGFNSLHLAAAEDRRPAALGAVVATYATDDRYTDDVHYCGGVLRALDIVDYPLYMVAMNALPPVPAVFGPGWVEEWRRRLDETPPWLIEWLANPLDGPTWRRGSIRLGPDGEGYDRIDCPVMLIAGWADGYRNNTFRVIEQYEANRLDDWRLIAGPWVHKSPKRARPGPNIDDDTEIIAFFDHHLRGGPRPPGAPARIYVRGPVAPEPDLAHHPGRWCELETWPPHGLRTLTLTPDTGNRTVVALPVRGDVGVAAWNSCGGGLPWGQPLDQRFDNAASITVDWDRSDWADGERNGDEARPIEIMGQPTVRLQVRSDQTYGHVSAKLCDVFPDGTSALITRGMLDLTHRGCWPADPGGRPGTEPSPLVPGRWYDVTVVLEATTWTLVEGHRLRLAVAGTDWPNCWPPPGPLTLEVDLNAVTVNLPVGDGVPDSTHPFGPGSGPNPHEAEGVTWRVEHDVLERRTRVVTRYGDDYDGLHGAHVSEEYRGELSVSTIHPALAEATGRARFELAWPGVIATTEARLHLRSDHSDFHLTLELDAAGNVDEGEPVGFSRRWKRTFPRLPVTGSEKP